MVGTVPLPGTRTLLLTTVLLAAGLAGCASEGGDGGSDDLYESFDAAMRAPGNVYEPAQHTGGVDAHLKLLEPRDPDNVQEGENDVVILLFDAGTNEPLDAASVRMEAQMPSMGHGATGDERNPAHDAHAVYAGMTTLGMPGNWVLAFDVTLSNGESFQFEVPLRVSG